MPAIDKNDEVLYLETSRQVDENLNSTGLGTRKSSDLSIEQQLKQLAKKIDKKPVTIFDDVAFGGDTILEILDKAKQVGLSVTEVSLGIATTDALARIGQADYSCSSRFTYDQILDEICERDFFVGAPNSGRTIKIDREYYGLPYLLPYGKPIDWASIPESDAMTFSVSCLAIALSFWTRAEQTSQRPIYLNKLTKPPFLNPRQQTIVKSIELAQSIIGKKYYMKYKLYIFDLDGTLYRRNSPSNTYEGSSLEAQVNANARRLILNRGWATEETVDGVMSAGFKDPVGLSNYLQNTFDISRKEYFDKVWDIMPEGMLQDYEDVVAVIRTLATTSTLILITSAPKVWQEQVCNFLDISNLFDRIITAEDFKSKDEVFEALSNEFDAKNGISVGDQLKTDIEPAAKYGFQTLLIEKPQDIKKLLPENLS